MHETSELSLTHSKCALLQAPLSGLRSGLHEAMLALCAWLSRSLISRLSWLGGMLMSSTWKASWHRPTQPAGLLNVMCLALMRYHRMPIVPLCCGVNAVCKQTRLADI